MRTRPQLGDPIVIQAARQAAAVLEGMGYIGQLGAIHLLNLGLQNNTLTAVLHNLVAWQISELDPRWTFKPAGGNTPDLMNEAGYGIQIKASSNDKIKGNKISENAGYDLGVLWKPVRGPGTGTVKVAIRQILLGELSSNDWVRPEGTQWAILKSESQAKMRRVYP